jgi:hypothetical protein
MLKRLALKYWPLALFFVLIVAVLCMSRYAECRKAENQENTQASSPESKVSPPDADKGTKKTNKPKYPPSWVDTFAWPEGVTAWALFLTLFVIAWQSVETHAAAEATVASVEAAKQQADLIREQMDTQVHRERARLNLEVQGIEIDIPEVGLDDGLNLNTCIEITNIGHSNAFIKNGAARFVLVTAGEWPFSEASPEDFTPFSNTVEPSTDPVYSPIWIDYVPLSLEAFAQDIANGTRIMYLYGFVEYETLGIRWHRDFGYVWKIEDSDREPPDPESIVFQSLRDSTKLCVTGWWEQNLRLKNTEYR